MTVYSFKIRLGGATLPPVDEAPTLALEQGESLKTNNVKPSWVVYFNAPLLAGHLIEWFNDGVPWGSHTVTQDEIYAGEIEDYGLDDLEEDANPITVTHHGSPASNIITRTLDTTEPVLSSPDADGLTYNTASGSVTTDEGNGTLFWVTVLSAAPAPDGPQIVAGTDGDDDPAVDDSGAGQAVSGTGSQAVTGVAGLTASTAYKQYYVQVDEAGNYSNVVNASFSTPANLLGASGNETPVNTTGGSWDMTAREYAAGSIVFAFVGNRATNYDAVSLKFHAPDVATDPTGTTITITRKAGGVSGFNPMVAMGVLSLGSPTTGVVRMTYDATTGMFDVHAGYQSLIGLATITDGSITVHSGDLIDCASPGVIVAAMYIDGGSLSDVTWSAGREEIFDATIRGTSARWSMAAYQNSGANTPVSYTVNGTTNITRAAAIAMGT